jgi:hypothetical protein
LRLAKDWWRVGLGVSKAAVARTKNEGRERLCERERDRRRWSWVVYYVEGTRGGRWVVLLVG